MSDEEKHPLIPIEQIESIAEWAFSVLERNGEHWLRDVGDGAEARRNNDEWRASIEALRFCGAAAGLHGDAKVAALLCDMVNELTGWNDDPTSPLDAVEAGIGAMLHRGCAITPDVQSLAEHPEDSVRAAVASDLRASNDALPLLAKLSTDPVPDVRNAARETLGKVQEIAWWTGVFKSDPIARLPAKQARKLTTTFEKLAELLSKTSYALFKSPVEIAKLADKLPDELAIELCEQSLGSAEAAHGAHAIMSVLLSRPGGIDAAWRLAERWNKTGDAGQQLCGEQLFTAGLAGLPVRQRLRVCMDTAKRIAALPSDEAHRGYDTAGNILGGGLAESWPKGASAEPLLELCLAMAPMNDDETDHVGMHLAQPIIQGRTRNEKIYDRVLEARLADYPGAWKLIRGDDVLERAPVKLIRAAAQRAMSSQIDAVVEWAMNQLLARAHDPRRDGPRLKIVERWWAVPHYRRIIVRDWNLSQLALVPLRRELRAGLLDFAEAHPAMNAIARVYGGTANMSPVRERKDESTDKGLAAKELRTLADVLGPPAMRGPPTEGEWDRYRDARDCVSLPDHLLQILNPMPPGPWHPSDRALLDRVVARVRAQPEMHDAWMAAIALCAKPDPQDAALMDELVQVDDDERYIHSCRRYFRKTLGLDPPSDDDIED